MNSIPLTGAPPRSFARRTLALLVGAVVAGLLGGCGALRPQENPTRFYVLTPAPGANVSATAPAGAGEPRRLQVGLKPVELPRYLQSRSIVVRTGTNEIRFAEFDRWAEPLDSAIGQVLKENLVHAPNVAGVSANSRGDGSLDCEVTLQILACEGVRLPGGGGSVRFEATWVVRSLRASTVTAKRGSFTAEAVAWDGKDYGQLAGRLSEALAAAAHALAADLPAAVTGSPEAPSGETHEPAKP